MLFTEDWAVGRLATLCLSFVFPFLQPLGADIVPLRRVESSGDVAGTLDISGIALAGEIVVAASDETASIQLVMPGRHRAQLAFPLMSGGEKIDIEGVVTDGEYIYVAGSRSLIRKKLKTEGSREKNRQRFFEVVRSNTRNDIFRRRRNEAGAIRPAPQSVDLRGFETNNDLFKRFAKVPSNENAIDIWGVAVHKRKLFCGFRGPVLRGNVVPVLALSFDEPNAFEVHVVKLGGLGIWDITRASDHLPIIAPKCAEYLRNAPTPAGAKGKVLA
jgi:Protein of unknown function (DUF3616)